MESLIFYDFNNCGVEIYEYQGLFKDSSSNFSFILSWVLFISFVPFLIRLFEGKELSNYCLVLIVLFSLIPQIVTISYRSDYSLTFVILMMSYWLLLLQSHQYISPIRFQFNPGRIISKFPDLMLAVFLTTVLIYSFLTTGLRLQFDLLDVYGIRAEAREFGSIFPFNYIISAADNILSFFAVLLVYKRRYILFGFTLLVIFINFSIAGSKSILFILLCGLVGLYCIRTPKQIVRILIAALALISFSLIEKEWLDFLLLTFIYSYRLSFLPVELHNSYFSFFQFNELDLFRSSILKFFFDSPFDGQLQFLIGEFSIGDITARANNGLFSDAYMNLGSIGIFIYPFVLATFLRIFDGASSRIDKRLWFVIAIYLAIILISLPLTTALFSSGLLLFLLILYTFPRAGLNSV